MNLLAKFSFSLLILQSIAEVIILILFVLGVEHIEFYSNFVYNKTFDAYLIWRMILSRHIIFV